jgi:hypothetical protein
MRARHRDEMEALFLEALSEARDRGRLAACAAWLHAAGDLFAARGRHLLGRDRITIPASAADAVFAGNRGRGLMFGSDFRYALRSLLRQKFSALLVIGMLALGIAANIAVFSFVNGLFLRPFPFSEPDRLVHINEKAPSWNLEEVSIDYIDFRDWRDGARVFDSMACTRSTPSICQARAGRSVFVARP